MPEHFFNNCNLDPNLTQFLKLFSIKPLCTILDNSPRWKDTWIIGYQIDSNFSDVESF